jgi:hypothetical protein
MLDFWWTKYGLSPRTCVFPLSVSYHDFVTGPLNFSVVNTRKSGLSLETIKKLFLSNVVGVWDGKEVLLYFLLCRVNAHTSFWGIM